MIRPVRNRNGQRMRRSRLKYYYSSLKSTVETLVHTETFLCHLTTSMSHSLLFNYKRINVCNLINRFLPTYYTLIPQRSDRNDFSRVILKQLVSLGCVRGCFKVCRWQNERTRGGSVYLVYLDGAGSLDLVESVSLKLRRTMPGHGLFA